MTLRTTPEVGGMGHSIKRKEDPRFIRGQGRYVDDIQLPGMLYLDIVRSPFAHARIKKIDTERALKVPGVLAVITGDTLAKYNLHWMPTLMSDTQMVLPTEKVMYQSQEVAAVVATDRYSAADGVEAVEVDYDPLPVVVDPFKALAPGAPVLRTDKKDKKDNHIFHWEVGDRQATEKAFASAEVTVSEDIYLPRIHVASIETCGCVADFDRVTGKLTVYMTTQAPHAIRTVVALVAGHVGLSEEKIRIVSPDIGGGFGGKVPVYPGYVIAIAASVVIGKPVKWIEDRMENLQADSFARDYHMKAELAGKKDGTLTALRIKTVADHGYADAAANPSKFPAGLFSICTGSYDFKNAFAEVDGAYTNKAPGGIAYRCSFRVTEAAHAIERMVDVMAQKLGMDPADLRLKNFIPAGQVPLQVRAWLGIRQRQLRRGAEEGDGEDWLRRAQKGAARETPARRADGHRHLELHRDRRRRAVEGLRHPRHQDVRLGRNPRPPDRQGHRALRHEVPGAGTRNHLRADHRGGARHPGGAHRGRRGRHRHRAVRTRYLREPLDADGGSGGIGRRAQDSGQGEEDRGASARGQRRRPRMGAGKILGQGGAAESQDDSGNRVRRVHQSSAGHGSRAGGGQLLRSAQPHLPLRQLHHASWTSIAGRAR